MMTLLENGFLDLTPLRLEYRFIGPRPDTAPTLILLHEGLGSAAMWGDFPEKLAAASGCGVFAWSRVGYGHSSPAILPRQLDFMHVEAREILPRLLDAIGFRTGLLVGHSDGASIAAIYGGSVQDHRVRGLVLMAPHFIVEGVTINSIREIREAFDTTDVRQRFQRWHADADATVRGWTDVWMTNDFGTWDIRDELAYIRVPILIIQGEHDHYGTGRQIAIAQEECYCPVEVMLLPNIKHVPHREAPAATLTAIADFARRLLDDRRDAGAAASQS
ncbi:MAG TPA: alpha/beta hydrolase, partial [Burkholderiales bacterium]|nr:alpha/beta hydrolase [Burkholderiales bacterium]